MKLIAYLKLMRFHKPVGILLLGLPTAWALWLANHGNPPVMISLLFFTGTILMRAAGCVINDIADRHIDCHVKRTQDRPLSSGKISLSEAFLILLGLLFMALLILIQLPAKCFYYALLAVFITGLYPFCKRFIQGPQLILGLAFSMGIPMAYVASNVPMDSSVVCLFMINFLWIVAYDTLYAMADRDDDLRIGVKSTAVFFAHHDRLAIICLQIIFHGLWLVLAYELHFSSFFLIYWLFGGLCLVYQQQLIVHRQAANCLKAFSINSWYGIIMWLGLINAVNYV